MGLRNFKPTSAGTRGMIVSDFTEITQVKPEKSLLAPLHRKAGRNNQGRICVSSRGGGHKRFYRIIDFKRDKDDIPAKVVSIEYDPNRSARIALLSYLDGEKKYILAPDGLEIGEVLTSGENVKIKPGNALPLKNIPGGSIIHNVELVKGRGGQLARSGGVVVQLMAKEKDKAILKLPSGEERFVSLECRATIGQVSNLDAKNVSFGKAGKSRWLGRRPHVRGVAKNPCDHPHGGGEGKSPIGKPTPVTHWGKPTLGFKTRKKRKLSSKWIIRKRK